LTVLQTIFVVLITFYSFFQYVYDFRPKHCKQTLYNIIMNPVPGVEFEGPLGEADDFEALWHQRFDHNIVALANCSYQMTCNETNHQKQCVSTSQLSHFAHYIGHSATSWI
jgi:hypothetical protein